MCVGGSTPSMPKPPVAAKPTEALKEVTQDAAASRDNTMRRLAQRLSLKRTNATSGMGLTGPAATTNKTLLGS